MAAVLDDMGRTAAAANAGDQDEELLNKFKSRSSNEIVIAFAGPIGCGIGAVVNATETALVGLGYKVVPIKLSGFLTQAAVEGRVPDAPVKAGSSSAYTRYRRLQRVGSALRNKTENQGILAEYAIHQIREKRQEADKSYDPVALTSPPPRIAYLIDQVKRPEEVALLRALYRNLFYLVGVHKNYDERLAQLQYEGVKEDESKELIHLDRSEEISGGQQLDKTLHLADYFIRSNEPKTHAAVVARFLKLAHGDKTVTPTAIEQGMYAAYSAGLRSACLSRQVGAAIAAADGEIISTGCNDVPRAGGGLYSADSPVDNRCMNKEGGFCFNDDRKDKLQTDIFKAVLIALESDIDKEKGLKLSDERRESLQKSIANNSRIKALGEFSRSVHAEMDAIVSLARSGTTGVRNGTLYTTTFPCHSCARHIVAAGILKVYYIEPYAKSLAKDLHGDDISFEFLPAEEEIEKPAEAGLAQVLRAGPSGTRSAEVPKVRFVHFEGVAPRRFPELFAAAGRKNGTGRLIRISANPDRLTPEYVDNYLDFETKAIAHLKDALDKAPVKSSA